MDIHKRVPIIREDTAQIVDEDGAAAAEDAAVSPGWPGTRTLIRAHILLDDNITL